MDLRSGTPYFAARNEAAAPTPPPIDADASCDVVVVGAGVTGALVAHALAHAGLSCIVLDGRLPAAGSTAASTSLLQYEIDVPLTELAEKIGAADAARAYRLCHDSIDALERTVATLGDTCGFARRPSLFLAERDRDVPRLRAEAAARAAIGIDAVFMDEAEVKAHCAFIRPGAIRSSQAAQVDPVRLTRALFTDAAAHGARLHAASAVVARYAEPDGASLVVTAPGPKVRARRVVYCTGYESQTMLAEKIVRLRSTYAIATAPHALFEGWPDRSLIWDSADPYLYLRTTDDDRIIIGGLDEPFRNPTARDALLPLKRKKLERLLDGLLPGRPVAEFAWTGTFGETDDGLAYGGASPEHPGALFALGFGGNGITFSVILATIIRDLVHGRANPDARLFRFGR